MEFQVKSLEAEIEEANAKSGSSAMMKVGICGIAGVERSAVVVFFLRAQS